MQLYYSNILVMSFKILYIATLYITTLYIDIATLWRVLIMNVRKSRAVEMVVLFGMAMIVAIPASAFWQSNDNNSHPLSRFGWGNEDGLGPLGGSNGWGAMDSMVDGMGMGDSMSDMNTDVEWDLSLDTKLKGKAQGDGRARGDGKTKSRNRNSGAFSERGNGYNYPVQPYYPQQPYQGQPYPYPPQQQQYPVIPPYGYAPGYGQSQMMPPMQQMPFPPQGMWR
jgi:hypothetical protein